MNRNSITRALGIIAIVALAVSVGALAQSPSPVHLAGLINDYTPKTINGSAVGPWEIRGEWSLTLQGDSDTANFSAILTMEKSDYWVYWYSLLHNVTDIDTLDRTPHTHHITLVGGMVNPIANGFSVSGPVTITGNGNAVLPNSNLEVDITGGDTVAHSNITLKFTGGAAGHFGSQAIHGVVSFGGPPPSTP